MIRRITCGLCDTKIKSNILGKHLSAEHKEVKFYRTPRPSGLLKCGICHKPARNFVKLVDHYIEEHMEKNDELVSFMHSPPHKEPSINDLIKIVVASEVERHIESFNKRLALLENTLKAIGGVLTEVNSLAKKKGVLK